MIYTTHILFASILTLLIIGKLPISLSVEPLQAIFIASLGSLIPDVDHPSSYINKKFWRLFSLSGGFNSHRGWTHSFLGGVMITAIFLTYLIYTKGKVHFIVPFFIGYCSHLLIDSLNPSGVAWFWPSKRRIGIRFIKTGSFEESMLQIFLTIVLFTMLLIDVGLIKVG